MENRPDQQLSPQSQYAPQANPYPPTQAAQPSYPPTQAARPPYPTTNPYPPTQAAQSPYPATNPYPYTPMLDQAGYTAPPPPYPYGPPLRQPKNYLWLIIVAAVLVVAMVGTTVAVVASRSNSGQPNINAAATSAPNGQPTTIPGQGTATPPLQSSPAAGAHKVGDTVSIDGWQIVVNGAKTSQGGQFDPLQHAGDVFLEIDVSLLNQTGQSQDVSDFLNWSLKDSTGQQYDPTIVSDAPTSPTGKVASGSRLRGTLAYEVPGSMHSFELDFTPQAFSSNTDVALWSISV